MPGTAAVDQSPVGRLARLLLQRDAALHGGLQTTILSEHPPIALKDGLLNSGHLVGCHAPCDQGVDAAAYLFRMRI